MKSAQHGASPLSYGVRSRAVRNMKIGLAESEVEVGPSRVESEASPGNPVSFPGKHRPPPTPRLTSEVNRPRPPRRPDPTPWPKIESRRVTLECQTLKVRETVRRSFVTDLPEFRNIFIRPPVGSPSLGLRYRIVNLLNRIAIVTIGPSMSHDIQMQIVQHRSSPPPLYPSHPRSAAGPVLP